MTNTLDATAERKKAHRLCCRYNEKPLRDVNGSALNGVPDMALIDCIVSSACADVATRLHAPQDVNGLCAAHPHCFTNEVDPRLPR
jgi:hypothetical protein